MTVSDQRAAEHLSAHSMSNYRDTFMQDSYQQPLFFSQSLPKILIKIAHE